MIFNPAGLVLSVNESMPCFCRIISTCKILTTSISSANTNVQASKTAATLTGGPSNQLGVGTTKNKLGAIHCSKRWYLCWGIKQVNFGGE